MIKITQVHASLAFRLFTKKLMKKYNLKKYNDIKAPCLFYGVNTLTDVRIIEKHIGKKLVVFCGSDVLKFKSKTAHKKFNFTRLTKLHNITFISISKFIGDILDRHNISHKYIPIAPTITSDLTQYYPIKKGQSIYIYTSFDTRKEIYGYSIWTRLIKQFPKINFIVAVNPIHYKMLLSRRFPVSGEKFPLYPLVKQVVTFSNRQKLLENAYKKCFLCLRLTSNDGNSATVQELGLYGIKSVHNGSQPCAINYKSYNDIVKIITDEQKTIKKTDNELHKKMIKFSNLGDSWLYV